MEQRRTEPTADGPQSVRRALELLMMIARSSTQLGVTQLAKRLDVHPSTVSRLLNVLEAHQLVNQDPATERFELGPGCLQLGQVFLSRVEISEIAEPFMHALTEKTGLMTHLAVLRADRVVHLKHVLPDAFTPSRPTIERYALAEVYSEALGKVLLAFQPDEVVGRILDNTRFVRFTDTTITTRKRMLEEVERVRKNGYAVDDGEGLPYIRCVAVPVWNHAGKIEAALSVSGPSERVRPESVADHAARLRKVAGLISRRIGAGPATK
jgi:DNA-binding IclR family transcriptional regulator